MIDSLPGLFLVIDALGNNVRWNLNLETVFGYDAEELARMSPLDLADPEARGRILQAWHQTQAGVRTPLRVLCRAKNGRRVWVEGNGSRVELAGKEHVVIVAVDYTPVQTANTRADVLYENLKEGMDRLRAHRRLDGILTAGTDSATVLRAVLEQVKQQLRVDAASILLLDEDKQALRCCASTGFVTDAPRHGVVKVGEGIAGRVARTREVDVITDKHQLLEMANSAAVIEAEGLEACITVPLVAKGELQGVMQLFHRSATRLSRTWLEALDAISAQAAVAINNVTLVEGLKRAIQEQREAWSGTIEALARALDLRDEETAGHSMRVTRMAVDLAAMMGVEGEDLVQVERGAQLHDIGKMGIPDAILLKPGKLSDAEWAIMKRHTEFAAEFLGSIPFLARAVDIPYCHHEKWDGTGYPRGLKGEEIPLAARVFAVVDVYDALTSHRPYRAAWSTEQAIEHIRKQSGSHFDPGVVEVFLEYAAMKNLRTASDRVVRAPDKRHAAPGHRDLHLEGGT